MQAIDIKNLSFSYGNIKVFENLNLIISEGSLITILGKNGSGKTTLVNILSGRLKYSGNVLVFNNSLNSDIIKKNIITIFDDLDEEDTSDTVIDMLAELLKKKKVKNIKDKIIELASEFDFSEFLNMEFVFLPLEKKKLVFLAMALVKNPKILILDNFFEGINKNLKDKILKKLKREVKKNKMAIVNVSNDSEEALYADVVVIIGNGKILLKGSKRKVFEKEAFFETYDLELPFIVSLSDKLKFYELIDKVYFDEKKLVDDLWE